MINIDWHGITKNKEERWNYPYINPDTGTWWEWSAEQNAYVNTEINALGYTGETGEQGERGPKGDPGTSVYVTSITPSSADGGGNVVTFSDGTSMTVYNGSKGAAGPAGRDGVDGLPGAAGSTGPQGPKGDPGISGTGVTVVDVSESGVDGGANIVTFSDGTTMSVLNGNTGSQGPRGFQGERGEQGPKGDKGDKGDPGSAAEEVVEVSGSTPTITGKDNTRYVCGTVTSISITPPATGTIDVVFTSGSTAATLTLPNTVKMPDWFDQTALETGTIYEIMITDGIYGVVTSWTA